MGRYLDALVLKNFARSTTAKDIGIFEEATLAAEEFLDEELGRRVQVAPANPIDPDDYVTYVYRPRSRCSEIIWIDDFAELDTVTASGTTLAVDTGYIAEPLNRIDEAGRLVPFDRLVKPYGYWPYAGNTPNVTVRGVPGWPQLPPMIYEAAKVAGKAHVEYRDIRFGLVALAESGGVGERQAKAVSDAIRAFESHRKAAIA